MLNLIWLGLLVVSAITALLTGNLKPLVNAIPESAMNAFKLSLGLTGIMALWLGIMRIAETSGLTEKLSVLIAPLMRRIFPGVPKDHPAVASMAANMVANMFGLNNAATPLGIKAMKDLETLNPVKGSATHAMCMFLALNTSSLQLVPFGAIALLAAGGSSDPTIIIFPAIIATSFSTISAFCIARMMSKMKRYQD
ncbi:MAG: nucleoside recognition protein [Deltaproteobacteria bacterium]|nr:nucleoside recognition protein [Deltaproteobacteria bacterium]